MPLKINWPFIVWYMNIFVWIRLLECPMNLFVWIDSFIVSLYVHVPELWMLIVQSNNQFRLKGSYINVLTVLEHSMNSQMQKNSFVTVFMKSLKPHLKLLYDSRVKDGVLKNKVAHMSWHCILNRSELKKMTDWF